MLIWAGLFFLLWAQAAFAVPQYYCTAANAPFFEKLKNLIGSIHQFNYDELEEIAVFDLGLTSDQIDYLKTIQKVNVYTIKEDNPDLLRFFHPPYCHPVLGWYAWKPVVIKESLEMFPYVLWLDAGTTVKKSLGDLFEHIVKEGYFVCTVGDRYTNGISDPVHPVRWGTTHFVNNRFQLNSLANRWILSKESVAGCIVGSVRGGGLSLIDDWYVLTKDIRYFADDGTAPNGFGTARHDQTLLSVLAYLKGIAVHLQDWSQRIPIMLSTEGGNAPFYITWHQASVNDKTCIYSSRHDLSCYEEHISHIRPHVGETKIK